MIILIQTESQSIIKYIFTSQRNRRDVKKFSFVPKYSSELDGKISCAPFIHIGR